MFTNHILFTEIARQHQSEMLARSQPSRWFRSSAPGVMLAPSACAVIDLPAPRLHSRHGDALVA